MEDSDLLARRSDDPSPWEAEGRLSEEALCARLGPRLRLYGLRHLRDEALAADLAQEALVRLIEALREGRVDDPEHVDRFALGICRHLVARYRRGEIRTRSFEHAARPLMVAELPPAFAALDRARLALCLGQIDRRARQVLVMTFHEEQDAETIATALSMSSGNVRVVRHRSLSALQRCMEGHAP